MTPAPGSSLPPLPTEKETMLAGELHDPSLTHLVGYETHA